LGPNILLSILFSNTLSTRTHTEFRKLSFPLGNRTGRRPFKETAVNLSVVQSTSIFIGKFLWSWHYKVKTNVKLRLTNETESRKERMRQAAYLLCSVHMILLHTVHPGSYT
jgi:hypothetical protein